MNLADAQQDMRHAYLGGATGLLASGLAWLVAGGVAATQSPKTGALALLAGGMLIFPASVLLAKAFGRPGKQSAGNPLAALALEGTGLLIVGILVAYALALVRVELFFPAMLLLIGGRYLTFQTLYGLKFYWVVGVALAGFGLGSAVLGLGPVVTPLAGGLIEIGFGSYLLARQR